MSKDFFVMLNTPNGTVTPLETEEDSLEVALFGTREAADAGAKSSVLGEHFGYEIFERGCGC